MDDEDEERGGVADGARPAGPVATPSLDTVFDLLSNRRRRYAVYYLVDDGGDPVDCEALAERVAAWEVGDDPSDERVERVAADLTHIHLPKLDAANVVDFDDRSGQVRFWGQPSVEEYAEHAAMQELPDR